MKTRLKPVILTSKDKRARRDKGQKKDFPTDPHEEEKVNLGEKDQSPVKSQDLFLSPISKPPKRPISAFLLFSQVVSLFISMIIILAS
jgi:hypothetical protein